ncbi:unnamed protein product, partial [Phaeothamnion confervicola]
ALRPGRPADQRVDLITCFSTTMWIHLNGGDDGLKRVLTAFVARAEALIVEPQPWRCYRNARERLRRRRRPPPAHFDDLRMRGDIEEDVQRFLFGGDSFTVATPLAATKWKRVITLYTRQSFEPVVP